MALGDSMKVGIVGSGYVGSTAGYALVLRGIGREVLLVDKNAARARAEADDIRHAVPFAHPIEVRAGDYADLAGSSAVIISAGVNQQPGESRLELLQRNAQVFRDVVPQILAHAPRAVLIVATNPVDVMTHLTVRYAARCGVPAGRVVGSGTTLDTARFRTLLAHLCGVDSQHVHGHVIGEHGDSEVLTWSLVTVGGMPLDAFCRLRGIELTEAVRQEIDTAVHSAACNIISGKGATYYGIGCALARITDVVLHDQRAILTVSSPVEGESAISGVTLSLPRLVGGAGVLATLLLPLSDLEQAQLQESAQVIRQAVEQLAE
jgi:L-lactate dehydrogenase